MKKTSKLLFLLSTLTIAAFSSPASAATWSLEKNVTGVEVYDDVNNGGSGKHLTIFLESAGTYCGSSHSYIQIPLASTTEQIWDHWVKLAETALLSGRKLEILSSNNTGSCKPWSFILK